MSRDACQQLHIVRKLDGSLPILIVLYSTSTAMQDQVVPSEVAAQWLPQYAKAISAGDAAAVADLILPVGWFRDVLTFTWDLRSLEGTEKITAYLSEHLKPGDVSELRLVDDIHCIPSLSPKTAWSDIVCVEAAFTYETKIAHGRGYVRLVRAGDEGPWKAASVCMMVFDLKGHEESGFEHGMYGDHTLAWSDVLQERRAKIEADPQVVISKLAFMRIIFLHGLMIIASWRWANWPASCCSLQADEHLDSHCREEREDRRQLEAEISHSVAAYSAEFCFKCVTDV